jgi:hypothetical protein
VANSTQYTGRPSPSQVPVAATPTAGNAIGRAVERYPFLTTVVATIVLAFGTLAFFNPRYETNDDVMMNLIAAGRAFADRPDEHLLFINVVLGWPLSRLYMLAPAVPWYGISQFAALLAAAAGTAYALLRVGPSLRRLVVVWIFFVMAMLPCLILMQYTKTAFLVSLAGMLLFLAPLRGAAPWPRAAEVAAGLLVLLGSLIRIQSFLMAAVVAAPLVVVAIATAPRTALRRALLPSLTLAAVAALYFVNRGYYASDPDWHDFYANYAARSPFTDYQRYAYSDETEPAFEAIGWHKVDWEMLMNWFYADREIYSLQNLHEIAATVTPAPRPPLKESVEALALGVVESPIWRQLVLATICVAVLTGSGWQRFLLPCALLGLAFGLAVFLRIYFWNPPRVLVSLFAGALACCGLRPDGSVGAAAWSAVTRSTRIARAMAYVCAAYMAFQALNGMSWDDSDGQFLHAESTRVVRRMDLRSDKLYVAWREQFPFEHLVVPLQDPTILRNFRCLSLSCVLDTPFTERRLRDFNIDDIYKAVWERPDVFLVSHQKLLDFFERYVRLHYKTELTFRYFIDHREQPTFIVVQAIPKAPERKGDR